MQWKGEVFCRLVYYAQKTYKIGINAASIPVRGSLARETSELHLRGFSLSGACFPSASRSDALACMLALAQDKTAKLSALYLNRMQTKTYILCS